MTPGNVKRVLAVLLAGCACSGEIGGALEDAGALGDDAGQPPEDAGTDAGTPGADAGTPVVDAGTPVADAGTPVVDSGTPIVDAGSVVDAGPPPMYLPGNPCASGNGVIYFSDAGSSSCTVMDQNLSRLYRIAIPQSYRAGGALVVMLHGHPGTAAQQEQVTQLTPFAHAKGFVVLYPEGTQGGSGNTWSIYDFNGRPDDVLFLRNLVTKLIADLRLDPKRIYFSGFSGGGLMAHKMGRDAADVVAAIGSACGGVAIMPDAGMPQPSEGVAVIGYQADMDTVGGYCLAATVFGGQAHTDYEVDYWTQGNHCTSVTPAQPLCSGPNGTPTTVLQKLGTGCDDGADVVYYRLRGQGHTYQPVLTTAMNPAFNATTGLTTNDLFWNFFLAHPKR